MEERNAFKPRTQPKSRANEIPGAGMETDGQGVNRQAETEREVKGTQDSAHGKWAKGSHLKVCLSDLVRCIF